MPHTVNKRYSSRPHITHAAPRGFVGKRAGPLFVHTLKLAKSTAAAEPSTPSSLNQIAARPRAVQNYECALERTIAGLPDAFGKAVAEATQPMQEVLHLAKTMVQEHKPSRTQAIAAVINRWALPVVQVLLGAAVVAVGVVIMEISIIVLGATMCATGLALCITLMAGILAPHPLDAVKEFVERRQERDPEPYKPGMIVALDGGG